MRRQASWLSQGGALGTRIGVVLLGLLSVFPVVLLKLKNSVLRLAFPILTLSSVGSQVGLEPAKKLSADTSRTPS